MDYKHDWKSILYRQSLDGQWNGNIVNHNRICNCCYVIGRNAILVKTTDQMFKSDFMNTSEAAIQTTQHYIHNVIHGNTRKCKPKFKYQRLTYYAEQSNNKNRKK